MRRKVVDHAPLPLLNWTAIKDIRATVFEVRVIEKPVMGKPRLLFYLNHDWNTLSLFDLTIRFDLKAQASVSHLKLLLKEHVSANNGYFMTTYALDANSLSL